MGFNDWISTKWIKLKYLSIPPYLPLTLQTCRTDYLAFTGNKHSMCCSSATNLYRQEAMRNIVLISNWVFRGMTTFCSDYIFLRNWWRMSILGLLRLSYVSKIVMPSLKSFSSNGLKLYFAALFDCSCPNFTPCEIDGISPSQSFISADL